MGNGGNGRDIGDIAARVADRLDKDRLGPAINQGGKIGRVIAGGKAGADAPLRQRVRQQVVGAAVQRTGGDDVVTGLGNGLDRIGDRRLARGQGQRANAAFQRRHALLQHIGGGVHDPGVDVARHLQIEQVGPVLGVIKGIGHGLVDGHCHCTGGRVGAVTAMHGDRFGLPG